MQLQLKSPSSSPSSHPPTVGLILKFQSTNSFCKHMKNLHGVKSPLKCEKCGLQLSYANLKRHMKVAHLGVPAGRTTFNCEECGNIFGTRATFTKHQIEHARNNGSSLTIEQEQFLLKQQVKSDNVNTICDICGAKLSCALTLQRHKRTHDSNGFKPHTCKLCGKAYTAKRNLSNHIAIVHEQTKNFACKMCGKLFGSYSNLHDHEKRIHRNH